ncbi:hypothetical protein N7488_012017 [Penicillium malachiteum]|nr:hypothetical protein N7488_012017 [Penicillium malachiteum]
MPLAISDGEAIKLLKKEAGHLYRDWEAQNSILVTWQISFDHIRHTKLSAAGLFSLMSFFDRQGIPDNLIQSQPEADSICTSELFDNSSDEGTSESDASPDFEDDIATLRDYSFISASENGAFFTMHRLVQLTTRVWLKSNGQIEQWRETFIGILHQEFPTGEYKNWEKCQSLFPHIRSAMFQRPESRESVLRWARLLYRGVWYAAESGNIADMRDMASKSRKQRVKLLGAEDEDALSSTAMLAEAYQLNGRWEEAEQLEVQVMKTSKTKLGEDHPDTLTSMANLAFTWKSSARDAEAINLLRECLTKQEQTLGQNHPTTLSNSETLLKWEREAIRGVEGDWESCGEWETADEWESDHE